MCQSALSRWHTPEIQSVLAQAERSLLAHTGRARLCPLRTVSRLLPDGRLHVLSRGRLCQRGTEAGPQEPGTPQGWCSVIPAESTCLSPKVR